MRKTKEILRLHHEARRSGREIARILGVSPATVQECLRRARIAGVDWTAALDLNDTALEERLYPPPPAAPTRDDRPLPDFAELHAQLKRKGVTLALLWEEYKAVTPEGLQYSQFCERYRRYSARVDLVMRQPHRAGEKLFILYLLTAGRPARPVRRLCRADGAGRRPRYR
jgi:transposase